MQLYYIRHGQSTNNLLYATTNKDEGRVVDPKLTPLGQQQADRLADWISKPQEEPQPVGSDPQNIYGFGLTHIYSSLMSRAVATGLAIAKATGLPLHAWEDIHEEGGMYMEDENGIPQGKEGGSREYFEKNFPELVLPENMRPDGWWNRPYEAPELRPERARRFLQDLVARHGANGDRVAIVSHGGFYNHFLAAVLKLGQRDGLWFSLNNCAVTRLDYNDGKWGFSYMNRADFLPDDMIT